MSVSLEMNRNSQSWIESTSSKSTMDGKQQVEVKADAAILKSKNVVQIIPEHPIAIDTVFRKISLDLDAADLISCSQIWLNCYQITKEILKQTEDLTVRDLSELNTALAKVDKNIGHLILHHNFGHFRTYDLTYGYTKEKQIPEIVLNFAEDPKLKYLTQLTINNPDSISCFNRNIFDYLITIIGQRLQQLCIKDTRYIGELPPYAREVNKELFPKPEHQRNGKGTFKNMRRLELCSLGLVTRFELSIIGLASTFPNLVELNLKGAVMRNNTDDSYCIKKSLREVQVIHSPPQLVNLRKLTIHYVRTRVSPSRSQKIPSTATVQLSILSAMQLQLKYLEIVNASYFAHSGIIMEFLGTQSQTLETLHYLSTIDGTIISPFSTENICLPNVFPQLKEVTLAQLFINDKFPQTLEAIPNAKKIVIGLTYNDIWKSIPLRKNSSEVGKSKIVRKNVNNSQQVKNSSEPTININIKEVYIHGGVIKEDPWRNLKKIFPNCVNDSLHPKMQF